MPDDAHDARADRAADGDVRPEIDLLATAARDGPPYHDGVVVRVVPLQRGDGHPPSTVAAMVVRALAAATERETAPRLVVLPAGVGVLDPLVLATDDWTDAARAVVREAIARWCAACAADLPAAHPPVVLGLDGAVDFGGDARWDQAVQVVTVLADRALAHVAAKTKPRDPTEAAVLDVPWDAATDRPAPDALARQRPVARLHGEATLLLVCHDAGAFAARSRAASAPGGCADMLRAQYDALLAAPDAPRVAVNPLHQLPRRADARRVTSPVFQNAHRVLRVDYGVRVVAVAALHPARGAEAFATLHAQLRCDFAHVDVLVAPRVP